jgi:Cu/Ag efflux pump CusA
MNEIMTIVLTGRALCAVSSIVLLAIGAVCFLNPIFEAYSLPSLPSVQVVTRAPGQSASAIQRGITNPDQIRLGGISNVAALRTITLSGLSDIKVRFRYGTPYLIAKQKVIDRLSRMPSLPSAVRSQIVSANPIGKLFRYNRSDIARAAINAVFHNAILWIILAVVIQWIFFDDLRGALIAVAALPFALLLVAMWIVLRGDSKALPSNGAIDVGLIVNASVIAAEMVMRTLVGGRTKWPRDYFAGQANGNIAGEWARAIICAIARIGRRRSVPVAFIVCWSVVLFLGWELADAFASSTRMYAYSINCGVISSVIVFLGLADTLASELMRNSASRMPRDIHWLSVSTSGVPSLAGNMTTLRGAGVLLARIGDANEPQK